MRYFSLMALASALALTAVQSSQAAVVTWSTPTQIAADTDVSTVGTLFSAVNINSGSDTTVNGVTFLGVASPPTSGSTSYDSGRITLESAAAVFNYNALGSTTGSATYDALFTAGHGGGGAGVLTFNSLSVGQEYQVQYWANDSRPFPVLHGRTVTLQDPDGGSLVTLLQNDSAATATNLGQYAIGSFVADGASQTIDLGGPTGYNAAAVQLRSITSGPEPSSLALLALGLGVVGIRSRKRRK